MNTCSVCFDDNVPTITTTKCDHNLCYDCILQHISLCIRTKKIKTVVQSYVLSRTPGMVKLSFSQEHGAPCPFKDCQCIFAFDNLLKSFSATTLVATTIQKHLEQTKAQIIEYRDKTLAKSAIRWLVEQGGKCCSVCKEPIEKNGGCPNMYCTKCRGYFNWDSAVPVAKMFRAQLNESATSEYGKPPSMLQDDAVYQILHDLGDYEYEQEEYDDFELQSPYKPSEYNLSDFISI